MRVDSWRKRSSRRSRPSPVVDHPTIRNETLRVRRTGDRAGCRNRSLIAGVSSQTTAKQAAPKTMPAVEAARISSLESFRLVHQRRRETHVGEELAEQHHEVGQRHEPEGDRVEQPRDGRGVRQVGEHEPGEPEVGPAQSRRSPRGQVRPVPTGSGRRRTGLPSAWLIRAPALPPARKRAASRCALEDDARPAAHIGAQPIQRPEPACPATAVDRPRSRHELRVGPETPQLLPHGLLARAVLRMGSTGPDVPGATQTEQPAARARSP